MKMTTGIRALTLIAASGVLMSCASTGTLIETPTISLRNVEVTDLEFDSQTFLLDFDVINPNPFPLPIRSVSYGVELDGYRFARGETVNAFSIPASSDGSFAISVDVDLMRTAPQLLFIVREGIYRDIPYTLEGYFDCDIPLTPAVAFRSEGKIRLQTDELSADR